MLTKDYSEEDVLHGRKAPRTVMKRLSKPLALLQLLTDNTGLKYNILESWNPSMPNTPHYLGQGINFTPPSDRMDGFFQSIYNTFHPLNLPKTVRVFFMGYGEDLSAGGWCTIDVGYADNGVFWRTYPKHFDSHYRLITERLNNTIGESIC